jgi:hypothetical protein
VGLGLNSGLHPCKVGTLLLKPHLGPFWSGYFWRQGLSNCLPRLASNLDPADLSLPSS